MDFLNLIAGKSHFKLIVKTNKPVSELLSFDDVRDAFLMNVNALPIDGKANKEIIRFFKKNHKLDVEIVSGGASREKLFRVI